MIGLENKVLQSEGLTFRLLNDTDKEALKEILSDSSVTEPAGFLPAADDAGFDAFFAELTRYDTGIAVVFGGVTVGYIHVNRHRSDLAGYKEKNGVSVGFVIGKKYQNRGFATTTLKTVTKYLKARFDYCAADHFEGNEPSKRVIEKCGYRFVEKYSMYFEELKKEIVCLSYYC